MQVMSKSLVSCFLTHGVESRRLRSKHFAKNRLIRVTVLPTTAKVMMQ